MRFVPIVVVLLTPAVWNLVAVKYQHAHNPLPGASYEIEGRQMYIYCTGAGANTVVVEVGASATSLGWQGIQKMLSRTSRVCVYDRSGHGWSEPASGPHDAETIVRKLHELLDKAAIPRPLILMGHSAGGLYVREYAREFPREIAGVVLIDSSSPSQMDDLEWRKGWEQDRRNLPGQIWKDRIRTWSGWDRLTGNCHNTPSKELNYLAAQYDAETCRPEYAGQDDNELPYFKDSFQQAARLTTFGIIPLLIISRDTTRGKENDAIWEREQENLKSLSPLSWRVIAKGAGHGVHHDRPDLVATETILLANYLPGRTTPPFGTTLLK